MVAALFACVLCLGFTAGAQPLATSEASPSTASTPPVSAAAPEASETPELRAPQPTVSVWAYPIVPVLYLANLEHRFPIPLGANVPVARGREWVFELTTAPSINHEVNVNEYERGWGVAAAVGQSISFSGEPSGFFVQPKLLFALTRLGFEDRDPPRTLPPAVAWQASAGADIGYRWRPGALYVDLLLGAALGYVSGGRSTPTASLYGFETNLKLADLGPTRSKSLWFDLNVHLVRVGLNF